MRPGRRDDFDRPASESVSLTSEIEIRGVPVSTSICFESSSPPDSFSSFFSADDAEADDEDDDDESPPVESAEDELSVRRCEDVGLVEGVVVMAMAAFESGGPGDGWGRPFHVSNSERRARACWKPA